MDESKNNILQIKDRISPVQMVRWLYPAQTSAELGLSLDFPLGQDSLELLRQQGALLTRRDMEDG